MRTRFIALLFAGLMAPATGQTQGVRPELDSFRHQLDRVFLNAGINMDVLIDRGSGSFSIARDYGHLKSVPALMLHGPIDRPSVHLLITKLNLLTAARAKGFKMVYFVSKADGSKWFFDISKSGQSCGQGLCYHVGQPAPRPQ